VEALESENNRARRFHPKLNIAPQPIDIQKYKPDPFGCSTSRSGLLILHCQLLIPISNQQSAPPSRPFDIPWMVLDSSLAKKTWDWSPATPLTDILEEIAQHAEANPDWMERVT
jgi:nucleoside-diphosphate-sugar epimerase